MRCLPLYDLDPAVPSSAGGLALPVRLCGRLDLDSACSRCELSRHARNPCIPADGEPGGILLVGERPGGEEDVARRPMVGLTGRYLRDVVRRYWDGPVVYDNAVRCFCSEVDADSIAACRPYLARTIDEARPDKIIALGAVAWRAITGRSGAPLTQRRAYAWLGDVPVYQVIHNAAAKRNRFVAEWFEEDIAWALTSPPPSRHPGYLSYHEVETPGDAASAREVLSGGKWFSVDAETSGREYTGSFRVISVAASAPSGERTFVWGPEQLDDPATAAPLRALLVDAAVGKVGSNLKSDLSFLREFAHPVRNVYGDVRLWRKLDDPEASGALESMAELVGMGGHKDEMMVAIAEAKRSYLPKTHRQMALFSAKRSVAYAPPDLDDRLAAGEVIDSYSYGLVPRDLLLRYNARDSVATALLGTLLEPRLDKRDGLRRVWDGIVRPMSEAISKVESWGVPVSTRAIDVFDSHLKAGLAAARSQLDAYSKDFNPGSTRQVSEMLFTRLKLAPPLDTLTAGGKQSVDEEVLEYLAEKHPLPKLILDYRSLAKMRGTYCDGMREHVRPDGRIHPSILPDGARSGRTSCIARGTPIEVVRDVSRFPDGIPIEDVRAGDFVYTFDAGGSLRMRRVLSSWKTGTCTVVRIRWRGQGNHHEGHVDLTPEHLVRLVAGGWKAASELVPGDRVVALSRGISGGYARLWATGHEEIAREHAFVFEQLRGWRPAHVHHDDRNKLNNLPSNLVGLTAAEHLSLHGADTSDEVRVLRAAKARQQWADGQFTGKLGEQNGRWLGLSRDDVEDVLRENRWSVTLAARALGHDFTSFKGYVLRHGFDLGGLKKRNRSLRGTNNHVVFAVEPLPGSVDVFDLAVEEDHCFVAGELCVHNCLDPNLQNIPRADDSPEGKMARDIFVASPGHLLVHVDFKQLEYRVAAMLSQDPVMIELIRSGQDFHTGTAELVAPIMGWEKVEKPQRTIAKTLNFALLYRMAVRTLAGRLGISVAEAEKVWDAVLGKFRKFAQWSERVIREAKFSGYCRTWWDGKPARWRSLWRLADEDGEARSRAEHGALNSPIQGTAADFCNASIPAVVQWIEDDCVPAELVLAIHDALLLNVREDCVDEVAYHVPRIMTSWPSAGVPIEVDVEVGPSWGGLKRYKLVG